LAGGSEPHSPIVGPPRAIGNAGVFSNDPCQAWVLAQAVNDLGLAVHKNGSRLAVLLVKHGVRVGVGAGARRRSSGFVAVGGRSKGRSRSGVRSGQRPEAFPDLVAALADVDMQRRRGHDRAVFGVVCEVGIECREDCEL